MALQHGIFKTFKSKEMNRKQFFKRSGIGALAAVVAPKVITEATKQNNKIIRDKPVSMPKDFHSMGLWVPVKRFPSGKFSRKMENYEVLSPEQQKELYKYHQGESFCKFCKNKTK